MIESQYSTFENLPVMLNMKHIAEVLGISPAAAYKLAHSDGFPSIKVGVRLIVPRDKFLDWIEKSVSEK